MARMPQGGRGKGEFNMNAFCTILKTETKLAIRDGNMVIFGIAFPAGIMLLTGTISSPEAVRLGFAGIASIGICAAGLMGIPLTFATYRYEKILKRFKVTPVSPFMLFLAVSVLQTCFAVVSGLIVYLIARVVFGMEITGSPIRCVMTFAFVLFSVFSLGYLIAGIVPDVKSANLACTILYFPMLFLSGATVPYEIMPKGLQLFSDIFPLTQGIKLIKGAVLGLDLSQDLSRIIVLSVIAVISYALSLRFFRWE